MVNAVSLEQFGTISGEESRAVTEIKPRKLLGCCFWQQ